MEYDDITFILDLYPRKIKFTFRITKGDYQTFYDLSRDIFNQELYDEELKQVIYQLENKSHFMDAQGNIKEDYEGMTINELFNARWLTSNVEQLPNGDFLVHRY